MFSHPLAEYMWSKSPYSFAFNNPVYYVDPDGRMPFESITGNDISGFSTTSFFQDPPSSQNSNCPGGDCDDVDLGELPAIDLGIIKAKDKESENTYKSDNGEGIHSWGIRMEDRGRSGRAKGELSITDLHTGGSGKTFSNLLAKLIQKIIGTISRTNKIKKLVEKEFGPNRSSMENANEEPVEPPDAKVKIEEVTSVSPPWKSFNQKFGPRIYTETRDTLVRREDSARVSNETKARHQRKVDSIIKSYE